MSWVKTLRNAGNWGLATLAGVVSAMSLIKALVFMLDVGLKPFLEKMVDYYREILSPIYDLVYLIPWPFNLPEYAIDFFIVYMVGVGISVRLVFFGLYHTQTESGIKWSSNKVILGIVDSLIPYNFMLIVVIVRAIIKNREWITMTEEERIVIESIDPESNKRIRRARDNAAEALENLKKEMELHVTVSSQAILTVLCLPILVIVFFAFNAL